MLCMVIVLGVLPLDVSAKTTVTIQKDGDYENWKIWAWEKGQEGKDYFFDKVNEYGAVATVAIDSDDINDVGFITRHEDLTKVVEEDKYTDVLEDDEISVSNRAYDALVNNETAGTQVVAQLSGTDTSVAKGRVLLVSANGDETIKNDSKDTNEDNEANDSSTVLIGTLVMLVGAYFIRKGDNISK